MTNKDLIAILLTHNPEAEVMFMTQRAQPFENYVAGVVSRAEMHDQRGRFEPWISQNDVFLVVGRRIRPGSLSAWTVAEQKQAAARLVDQDTRESAVGAILRNFCSSAFEGDADTHVWERSAMMRSLYAAYQAGASNTAAQFVARDVGDFGVDASGVEDGPTDLRALPAPGLSAAAE
ncbi:MAG TPA: hypothetical protein VFP84_10540 [Kofleriaceae bacterium]|nr:hypothetical protein [Kofleriaceae bacterium]